ncbi:hypothetical protein C2E23DRAFT_801552 [Lenzites betulinus]|nr:hypothetical protein C2E23DRAFT_801552 [Lenzites betulinus]
MFEAFVLHPSRAPRREFTWFKKSDRSCFREGFNFLQAHFVATVQMRPRFVNDSEGGNELLSLQPVGWAEMVHNIVSINMEYQVPEDYPYKETIIRIIRPPT